MMEELGRMRLSELRERAAAFGLDAGAVEQAVEQSENPRAALLQMLEQVTTAITYSCVQSVERLR